MRLLSLSVAIAALLSGCLPRVEAKKEPTPQVAALPAMEMKVTVTVLDEETGKPVPDAWVLVAAHVTTNRPSPRDDLDTVAAARSITNQGGTASINEVEGTYYTWQNMDKIWTAMEDARARRLGPLKLTGMEGGSIVVASPIYGFIHQPFAVEDDPTFQEWLKQNGRKKQDYDGWIRRAAMRVNLPPVFVQSKDLKTGLALTIRMRKPRDLDEWAKTISYDHFLEATWSAMSIHNGATEDDQRRLYWLFARQLEAVAFKSKNIDHLRSFAAYLQDEAIKHYAGHAPKLGVHDSTLHLWLAEKALEILPPAYDEVKRHAQDVLKGAQDESAAARSHFYNPNDFKNSLNGAKTALAWGAIDNQDNRENDWDWQDAVRYHGSDRAKAYEALGHVVHLLADMASPERTHIIDPEQYAGSFEDYFASKTIAGLNALPWVYSVNAKTPLRVHTLKGHFDDLAKLTFGPMKDGGKIIDFDRYYRAIPGDKGRVFEQPDDKTMDGMGEYLLPKAVEYAAGLMEHFYDTVQPRTAVKEGPVGANEQVAVARSSGTETDKFNKFTSGTDTTASETRQVRRQWENLKGLARHQALSRVKGSRKTSISPIKQSDGIATGLVMAYGHVIPPPYQIEWSGNQLLINGVQVLPSLVLERERKMVQPSLTPDKVRRFRREDELENELREIYRGGLGKKSLQEVQAEITARVMTSSDVFSNPRWTGKDSLEVTLSGSSVTYGLAFSSGVGPKLSSEAIRRLEGAKTEKAHEATLGSIQRCLRKGQSVFFFAEGGEGADPSDIRSQVNEIMQSPGLTREQRIELLKERVFMSYGPALDVVENYSPDEWKTK